MSKQLLGFLASHIIVGPVCPFLSTSSHPGIPQTPCLTSIRWGCLPSHARLTPPLLPESTCPVSAPCTRGRQRREMTETGHKRLGHGGWGRGRVKRPKFGTGSCCSAWRLPKKPGPKRWGRRRKERGPVRGADGPAPGDPRAAAEWPVRVLKTPTLNFWP